MGWSRPQQWERLRFVVNNARFLILPDVHIPNLASKVLALNGHRLADDWGVVYGHRVALAETFVDPARFPGTAYQAAGRAGGSREDLLDSAPTMCGMGTPRRCGCDP